MRGTVTYLALFLVLRFGIRRQVGEMGITDLLVVVLLADAAQNAMGADYNSVADGIFLVLVIAFWAFAIDWLGYYWPAFEPIAKPMPKTLIVNGRLRKRAMRRELISQSELESMLREQGVEEVSEVREARMEPDGRLSVLTYDRSTHRPPARRSR